MQYATVGDIHWGGGGGGEGGGGGGGAQFLNTILTVNLVTPHFMHSFHSCTDVLQISGFLKISTTSTSLSTSIYYEIMA